MNTDHIIESLRPLAMRIADLKPDPRNARKHDQRNMDAIKASLQKFGQQQPILADADGVVVAGNARLAAMKDLGWEVAAVARTELRGSDARAYAISDNRTAELAAWDFDELKTTFEELRAEDYSVGVTGWTDIETVHLAAGDFSVFKGGPVVIASAAGKSVQVVEDESPAPMDVPATRPGDLWILGDHRLLCGDSGNPDHLDRLLGGAKIHLVNTDPPYNVKVEPRSNNAIAAGLSPFQATQPRAETHHQQLDLARHPEKAKATGKMRAKDRPLANDFMSDEAFDKCLDAWFGNIARVLVPGGGFYIWGGYANCANYPPFLKKHGLYFSQAVIWDKQHPVLTRKDFMGAHEWAFYGWKEGARVGVLRVEGGRCAPVLRQRQHPRHLAGEEGQPAVDGASHREARRARCPRDDVLVARGRERAGPLRRERQHADGRGADQAPSAPDGARHAVLRRDRAALAERHRPRRGARRRRADVRRGQRRAKSLRSAHIHHGFLTPTLGLGSSVTYRRPMSMRSFMEAAGRDSPPPGGAKEARYSTTNDVACVAGLNFSQSDCTATVLVTSGGNVAAHTTSPFLLIDRFVISTAFRLSDAHP